MKKLVPLVLLCINIFGQSGSKVTYIDSTEEITTVAISKELPWPIGSMIFEDRIYPGKTYVFTVLPPFTNEYG